MPRSDNVDELPRDLPVPVDDGACAHLPGLALPSVALPSTAERRVDLASLPGRTVGAQVFGLSTQDTDYQREAVDRLHLPFELLSDDQLRFARALRLPTFEVEGMTLLKRLTLIVDGGRVVKVFYPVFPPDRNAGDVVAWLPANTAS